MILIWKGKGWQVPLAAILGFVVTAEPAFKLAARFQTSLALPVALSLLGAAAATHFLVRRIERLTPAARQLVDPATGETTTMKPRHSLYFVPVAAWPYVLAGTSAIPFVVQAFYT